jgi:hypothetical protein
VSGPPGFVVVSEQGRSGEVRYRDADGEISFPWEFGGGDAVAIVSVGTAEEWSQRHAWAAGRRAAILRLVAAELVRQKAPTCRAEIDDAAGAIYLRPAPGAPPAPPAAKPEFSMSRYRQLRSALATVVFVLAALAAGVLWLRDRFLTIGAGQGTAVGDTVRSDRYAATLLQTLEPYVPSLHRDHSLDRYGLRLFLVPLDGSATRLVSLRGGLTGSQTSRARILGSDARTLWYDVDGTGAVDLESFAAIDAGQRPPPSSLLGPRPLPHANEPATFLAAGFLPAPDQWLGLHTNDELEREYRPGQWVRRIVRSQTAKSPRRLYRAQLDPDATGKYNRIVRIAPVTEAAFAGAAFLRPGDGSEPFRMGNPAGALMLYTSDDGLRGTTKVARVGDDGRLAWEVDTGIDRFLLSQILPGERSTVFVGPRPPVPDKVAEPLLVIVDHASGATSTHSLWQ